jgi:uncharacterized membrane protein
MLSKSVTKKSKMSTFQVAVAAVFAALVAVVTITFVVFLPASRGYFNLGDTVIYVAALLFGPFVGLIAGAGAAISDVVVAPSYVLVTFVVKSVEGFLVGFLVKRFNRRIKSVTLCAVLAVLIGGFEMIGGYFVFEFFMYGYGVALGELLVNVGQVLLGLIIAVPIVHVVLRVFPQFRSYLQGMC